MSKAFLKTLSTSRYGTISPLVRRIQNSNILVVVVSCQTDVLGGKAVVPAGTVLVPDWRHGGNEPCYMVYQNLNDALRGGANAALSQRANFDRLSSSPGRYELVFGERMDAADLELVRTKGEKHLEGQAGIVKNLALWQSALWLEREASLAALRLVKRAANGLLSGHVAWPVFRKLCRAEFRKLHCAPFASFANKALAALVGSRDTRLTGDAEGFVPMIEAIERGCVELLRDQSLEDVDACLSRAASRIRRQTGEWAIAAEQAFLGSYTLLSVAEAEHVWNKGEARKLQGVRSRIGMVRKAVSRRRLETAKRHLAAARQAIASLVDR